MKAAETQCHKVNGKAYIVLPLADFMFSFEFTPGPNGFCCRHEKSMKILNQLYDNFTGSFKKQKECVFSGRFARFGCNFSNIIFDGFRFV